jgi:hypothetical protein
LLGGLITSGIGWRASFVFQVLVVASIIVLAFRIVDPPRQGARPRFDLTGAILSAAGLFFVVLGVLKSRTYGWLASRKDFTVGGTVVIRRRGVSPVWLFVAVGALILLWFFLHIRSRERRHRDPLIALRMFGNRTAHEPGSRGRGGRSSPARNNLGAIRIGAKVRRIAATLVCAAAVTATVVGTMSPADAADNERIRTPTHL